MPKETDHKAEALRLLKPEGMSDEEFKAALAKVERELDEMPPETPEKRAELQESIASHLRVVWREIDGQKRRCSTFVPIDRDSFPPDFLRALGEAGMTVVVRGFSDPMAESKTDHRAEALRLVREFEAGYYKHNGMAALVHSNLAVAEGQERVAEEIKAFRELMAGSAT